MSSEDLSAHGDKVEVEEEYRHDNIKLFLMALACVFAATAQFGLATDFPKNRSLLGGAVRHTSALAGFSNLS